MSRITPPGWKAYVIFVVLLLLSIISIHEPPPPKSLNSHATAQVAMSLGILNDLSMNFATHSLYRTSNDTTKATNFTLCSNQNSTSLFIAINVTDNNRISQVLASGNASYKIMLFDGSVQYNYPRFGDIYKNFTQNVTTATQVFYVAQWDFNNTDAERKPPLYYRVLAHASDQSATIRAQQDIIFLKESCSEAQNKSVPTINNTDVTVNFIRDANLSLKLRSNTTTTGEIHVRLLSKSPVTFNDSSVTDISKFVEIDVSDSINSTLAEATLEIYYADSEVAAVNESSLKLFTWNSTAWQLLKNSTVNTADNYVNGTVKHFSLFAAFAYNSTAATPAPSPSPSPSNPAASGSGGGSGGGSGDGGIKKSSSSPSTPGASESSASSEFDGISRDSTRRGEGGDEDSTPVGQAFEIFQGEVAENVGLALLILVIAVGIYLILLRWYNKSKRPPKVQRFVQKAKNLGHTEENIRSVLRKHGWSDQDITNSLENVKKK